jgi:hypothetical protein
MKIRNTIKIKGRVGLLTTDPVSHAYPATPVKDRAWMILNASDVEIKVITVDKRNPEIDENVTVLRSKGQGITVMNCDVNRVWIDTNDDTVIAYATILQLDSKNGYIELVKDFDLVERADGKLAVCSDCFVSGGSVTPERYAPAPALSPPLAAGVNNPIGMPAGTVAFIIGNPGPNTIYWNTFQVATGGINDFILLSGQTIPVPIEAVTVNVICLFAQNPGVTIQALIPV